MCREVAWPELTIKVTQVIACRYEVRDTNFKYIEDYFAYREIVFFLQNSY